MTWVKQVLLTPADNIETDLEILNYPNHKPSGIFSLLKLPQKEKMGEMKLSIQSK
jgi:hypothetical protein